MHACRQECVRVRMRVRGDVCMYGMLYVDVDVYAG